MMVGSTKVTGGREGIRTLDLSVANAALSQLSYAPMPKVALGNITRQMNRRQASAAEGGVLIENVGPPFRAERSGLKPGPTF